MREVRRLGPGPSPRDQAEGQLAALLRATGIPRSGVYRPGEVCRLLRISRSTLLQLCAQREHPAVGHPTPRGLGSFLVGCHHRIPHEALVEWLGRNQQYERESG
ncbi:MAG: helix-turn-helix domain-containing protein [Chromatiaceae bacterium]|nr:helix-turn-helix domain-containing protein [Chromatiaceae bacterium]